ncbi:sulfurtransferase [Sulfurifustis variabilis]|uniref:Sulfurtransferase n=1 Tax=Sulfurifustis variabilis TaxID=1675686 RepID=A0A1B4VD72_9GAMM|nr:rhodanese-like domain-containing protein [Sulfurifustis variabilis]BAU50331.1 sulfurtransferase [Sulfurifustis variabilis]
MVQQLTVKQLHDWLSREGGRPVILDVREPWELQVCALPDSRHIPMRQIPLRVAELDPEAELVVVCHHGIRSQQVANYLDRQGFGRIYNLRGGVDAWAREIDPGMATY